MNLLRGNLPYSLDEVSLSAPHTVQYKAYEYGPSVSILVESYSLDAVFKVE